LALVELIEAQKLKLSPHARELWDEFDALIYLSEDDRMHFTPEEKKVMNHMAKLPRPDKLVLAPLRLLRAGLISSDYAESKGEPGEPHRKGAVISAARALDAWEGRQWGSYTTVEQALARLEEDHS
jgi:hypothetical protein